MTRQAAGAISVTVISSGWGGSGGLFAVTVDTVGERRRREIDRRGRHSGRIGMKFVGEQVELQSKVTKQSRLHRMHIRTVLPQCRVSSRH